MNYYCDDVNYYQSYHLVSSCHLFIQVTHTADSCATVTIFLK